MTHPPEKPITFEALSYALFDVDSNAVLTTHHGNLAIFSTKEWLRSTRAVL